MLLLRGFELLDDGITGERVTPTGAAILAHLRPETRGMCGRVDRVGHGLGNRDLDGIANVLRLCFGQTAPVAARDVVAEISFHVDDQSPEDLAIGLDHMRATPGVLDVLQMPVFGKKGRMTVRIDVMCERSALLDVVDKCFHETTTIGLRHRLTERVILNRLQGKDAEGLRWKSVDRPGGTQTRKIEADDLAAQDGHDTREALRQSRAAAHEPLP